MAQQRLNYFKGEFLQADDFETEQLYHREALCEHNRNLHTWGEVGIAWGLEATLSGSMVYVSPGLAVDKEGHQIILTEEAGITTAGGIGYLTIKYKEDGEEWREDTGYGGYTRIVENPELRFENSKPSNQIIIATVSRTDIDYGDRTYLETRVAALSVAQSCTIGKLLTAQSCTISGQLTANSDCEVQGDLQVVNGLTVGNVSVTNNATIGGSLSVSGITNVGSNLEVAKTINAGENLVIKKDAAINGNLSVMGTLSRLDVAENFRATVRAADFYLGYSGRRGTPGRAIVDAADTLWINYLDWPNTRIWASDRITLEGNVFVEGNLIQSSSRELKTQITDLSSREALALLDGLKPVHFVYKSDPEGRASLGFIAEEIPPSLASASREGIYPIDMLAVLTKVVKEQLVVNAQLVEEVKEIRRELAGTK